LGVALRSETLHDLGPEGVELGPYLRGASARIEAEASGRRPDRATRVVVTLDFLVDADDPN
jgi:hypothetical protein